MRWPEEYKDLFDTLSRFYRAYGGSGAVLRSPFFHAALTIWICGAAYWLNHNWWDFASRIAGSLLAFTLSGFALMIALLSQETRELLAETDGEKPSPLERLSSIFFHFIIVSCVSLLSVCLQYPLNAPSILTSMEAFTTIPEFLWILNDAIRLVGTAVAFFVFSYSLTLPIAVAIALTRIVGLIYGKSEDAAPKTPGGGQSL